MLRIALQCWISAFALLTVLLAGTAIGRWSGLSAGESAYLTLLFLALVGWVIGRRRARA